MFPRLRLLGLLSLATGVYGITSPAQAQWPPAPPPVPSISDGTAPRVAPPPPPDPVPMDTSRSVFPTLSDNGQGFPPPPMAPAPRFAHARSPSRLCDDPQRARDVGRNGDVGECVAPGLLCNRRQDLRGSFSGCARGHDGAPRRHAGCHRPRGDFHGSQRTLLGCLVGQPSAPCSGRRGRLRTQPHSPLRRSVLGRHTTRATPASPFVSAPCLAGACPQPHGAWRWHRGRLDHLLSHSRPAGWASQCPTASSTPRIPIP